MLGAGRRDRKVVFQRAVTVEDEYGEPIPNGWDAVATAWAAISYGRGSERRQAAAEGGDQAMTIRVLSTATTRAVLLTDRALLEGAPLDLVSIAPIGRTEIEFTAMRAVP